MVGITYRVQVVHVDHDTRLATIREALVQELRATGIHRSAEVEVNDTPVGADPGVVLYLGSPAAAVDLTCRGALERAVFELRTVVPVVDSLTGYRTLVPSILHPINSWQWIDTDPSTPARLARLLLEQLGIEERQRSVFISYKRDDGLLAAELLRDHLQKHAFEAFIDRFDIPAGADVQSEIADTLEKNAFLLLLETPLAATSKWVYDEVDYALSHFMGIHIVTWPRSPPTIPGSDRLPRQVLADNDLTTIKGYQVLTDHALDLTLAEIEAAHAAALVRRRRNLLRSVEDAALARGLVCTPLPNWRLLIGDGIQKEIVAVCPRLPDVSDLQALDSARNESSSHPESALLVHAARVLRKERRDRLSWAVGTRSMAIIPENAIGARW